MPTRKFAVITPIALACTAALLGGCGGGSSSSPAPVITPPVVSVVGVTLTGTAAMGAALANAKVEAKCGTLTGNTTSATDGSYTLKIDSAVLPCLLRATSADAASVLHSVAEGSGATAATANITPVTELVVAKAVGSTSTTEAAFSANTAPTTAQLSAAKTVVIAALKPITDLSGIDPLSTAFKAANGSVAGDATDKKLDSLMAALATAKLPLAGLSNAIITAPDAAAAVSSVLSAPPLASCPTLRSGSYAVISQRGEVFETALNLGTMRTTGSDGSLLTLVASAEACRFNVLDAQGVKRLDLAFGPESAGLAVTEATADGDRATSLVLPRQTHSLAALAGDWVAVEWDRTRAGTLPRFGFATATLAADGTGIFQGCTQTAGVADCTAADRKNTGTITINAKGQVVSPGNSPGFAFRASNGSTLIVWGKPNGDGITLLTRSAASSLPTAGSTRKVWESHGTSSTARPDIFAAGPLGAFDLGFTTVSGNTVTLSNGQVLSFNKPLPGLIYRAAGSKGADSWDESMGMDVPGVLRVAGGNTAGSASFGVSLQRP